MLRGVSWIQTITRQAIEAPSHSIVAVEQQYVFKQHECGSIISLQLSDIKIESFMRRIMFSSVACPAVPYFSTLPKKSQDFSEKKILNGKCVF